MFSLEPQQRFLRIEAAAKSSQAAVRSDYTMTWNDYRQRVTSVSGADRSYGSGPVDLPGNIEIAARFAEGRNPIPTAQQCQGRSFR